MITSPFSPLVAENVMTPLVISIHADSTLKEAWHILSEHRISGAPVIDKQGSVVGVVSQQDLVRKIVDEDEVSLEKPSYYYYALPALSDSFVPTSDSLHAALHTPVEEVMNTYVLSVDAKDPLPAVAAMMRSHRIHRVLVTEDNKIVGLISTFDLLSLIEKQ